MITIDGSLGEGGGQVLRTSVGLAAATGRAVRIERIRAERRKPGLMRQHLTAVRAVAEICSAEVTGATAGSRTLSFAPGTVVPGKYAFAVGTAGSATLVLQTVLPALMCASGPSELMLEGGTHNPWAPPLDFVQQVFLPLLARMGPVVTVKLDRPGFYPAGGGRFRAFIQPAAHLLPLDLTARGQILCYRARALLAQLPQHIAQRELRVVSRMLGWPDDALVMEPMDHSIGPGNALCLAVHSANVTELFTGFGRRGVTAEAVAKEAVEQVRSYLKSDVPVGQHLADQLLIPLAMGGGRLLTLPPTSHTRTNLEVIRHFLDTQIESTRIDPQRWELRARL